MAELPVIPGDLQQSQLPTALNIYKTFLVDKAKRIIGDKASLLEPYLKKKLLPKENHFSVILQALM